MHTYSINYIGNYEYNMITLITYMVSLLYRQFIFKCNILKPENLPFPTAMSSCSKNTNYSQYCNELNTLPLVHQSSPVLIRILLLPNITLTQII